MFEVLVFVYENYWSGDGCPEPAHLERKLSAVGFDPDEIADALIWLDGLSLAAHGPQPPSQECSEPRDGGAIVAQPAQVLSPSPDSMRAYSTAEQDHLGSQCLGFISFLETAGVLPMAMREIVLDRAMAAPGGPVALDDLKVIVLMVYWSLGEEPDALVLDELCEDSSGRLAH